MPPVARMGRALLAVLSAVAPLAGCATYVRFLNGVHPVAVFDGWRDGACRNDELYSQAGPGRVRIGRVDPERRGCPAMIVAFSESLGAVAAAWEALPTEDATLDGRELRIRFPATRALPTKFWVLLDESAPMPSVLTDQITEADVLFALHRVGSHVGWDTARVSATDDLRSLFEGECYDVAELASHGYYARDSVNVYVYFHEDHPQDPPGRDCAHIDGRSDVVFLYHTTLTTLAHELGHVMGLLEPNWGDIGGMDGFTAESPECPARTCLQPPSLEAAESAGPTTVRACEANLMVGNLGAVCDVTLGQIYRMNLDSDSFWNRFLQPHPFPSMDVTCQGGPYNGDTDMLALTASRPCPRLARRQPGYP